MVEIRRRRVFFIEGYEPQGAAGFHRMFKREWNRFCANWRISGTIQDIQIQSSDIASWHIETVGPNWQVSTQYEFLRLENYIARNLALPRLTQLGRALRWIADDIASGALARVFRASWRMGVLIVYSQIFLLLWLGLSLFGGWFATRALDSITDSFLAQIAIALIAAFAIFAALRPVVDAMFVNQLNNCWPYLREFARGKQTDFDRSIALFAERIVDAANANDTDEILIVGHSAGAMLALTATQRALAIDPDMGLKRARVSVLTLGSIMPALALHPEASKLRETIRTIATEPTVFWADCQAQEDFMNFWNYDPVSGVGINVGQERCNPRVWPVPVRQMISPENFKKARFNYWRMHYQYIMSNDRRASYDYFMFVCGPAPLSVWAERGQSADEAFETDARFRILDLKAAE